MIILMIMIILILPNILYLANINVNRTVVRQVRQTFGHCLAITITVSTGGYWKSADEDKTAGKVFSWECDLLLLRSAFWPDIQGSSSRQASIFMHTKAIYPVFKIKDFLVS